MGKSNQSSPVDEVLDLIGDPEKIQEEAKQVFSLRDRIRGGIAKRKKRIPIFLDVELVKEYERKLAIVEDLKSQVAFYEGDEQYSTEEIIGAAKERLKQAEAEAETAASAMYAETLSIHMHAIPRVALKTHRRNARSAIKGKITPANQEEYDDLVTKFVLTEMIDEIRDAEGNQYDIDPKALQEDLDEGQWNRILQLMHQLSLETQVGQAATDEPGF